MLKSKKAPRLRSLLTGFTSPFTSAKPFVVMQQLRRNVAHHKNSVFDGLRRNLFTYIHSAMASIQEREVRGSAWLSSPSNVLTDFQVLRTPGTAADIFDLQYADDFTCDNRRDWRRADVHASRDSVVRRRRKILSRRRAVFRVIFDSSSNQGLC